VDEEEELRRALEASFNLSQERRYGGFTEADSKAIADEAAQSPEVSHHLSSTLCCFDSCCLLFCC
jgi:hypothetical protein